MIKPCEEYLTYPKPNGTLGTKKTYSYVALLCKKDGSEVKAVRLNGFTSKYDINIDKEYPDWNVKGIWKLYDEDFQ